MTPPTAPNRPWSATARRFRPYLRSLIISVVFLIMLSALAAVQPLLLRIVVDRALPDHNTRLLVETCVAMAVAGAFSAIAGVVQAALFTRASQGVAHDLRLAVYDRLASASIPAVAARATSATQAKLVGDIGVIDDDLALTIQSISWSATLLLSLSIAMIIINWPLALISLGLAVVLALFTQSFANKQYRLAGRRQDQQQEMMKRADESLSLAGIIMGRTLERTHDQREEFESSSSATAELRYRQRMLGRLSFAVIGLAFGLIPPLIYLAAGTVLHGVTIGSVVAISLMQTRLSAPLQELFAMRGAIQGTLAVLDRIITWLEEPAPKNPSTGVRQQIQPDTGLYAYALTYQYPESTQRTVQNCSFAATPGAVTFICGPTGSGKSTLALILAGLIEPDSGTVEYQSPREGGRPPCCLVPQESVLLNDTIRANMAVAAPNASEAALLAAIHDVQLDDLLAASAEGLDSRVGERGYQVSGGERQRFAIARALLRDADVLILDESLSALDEECAERVFDALRQRYRDRILIVVTHRLPRNLTEADQIVTLTGGSTLVAEPRSHERPSNTAAVPQLA